MVHDQPPKQIEYFQHTGAERANEKAVYDKLLADSGTQNRMTFSSGQDLPEGPIKNIDLPKNWARSQSYDNGVGSIVSFKSPGDKSSFTSLEHDRPVSAQAAQELQKILDANPNLTTPKALFPAQIRNLTEVLGSSQLGDNQYTNATKYPSPNAPMFKLTNAQLVNINGKTSLEVEGSYMEQSGSPSQFYRGIINLSGKDGKHVNEFFLAGPDQQTMIHQDANYRKAVKSIKWR